MGASNSREMADRAKELKETKDDNLKREISMTPLQASYNIQEGVEKLKNMFNDMTRVAIYQQNRANILEEENKLINQQIVIMKKELNEMKAVVQQTEERANALEEKNKKLIEENKKYLSDLKALRSQINTLEGLIKGVLIM